MEGQTQLASQEALAHAMSVAQTDANFQQVLADMRGAGMPETLLDSCILEYGRKVAHQTPM